jgi:hypothetical protein
MGIANSGAQPTRRRLDFRLDVTHTRKVARAPAKSAAAVFDGGGLSHRERRGQT